LQVLQHVYDAFGLAGRWAWHGLWAHVQIAAHQLLLEPHSKESVQHMLLHNLAKEPDTFYEAQGHLRHVFGIAALSNTEQNSCPSKYQVHAALM
jgi:hypothetical protein